MKGEVEIVDSAKNFYKALYTGEDEVKKKTVSSRKSRFVESSASDAMYSCSGGKILPGKHLSLGFTVKALPGSKNVVTLMNRYGHCGSSETIRRINMSLEATINDNKNVVPTGIRKLPFLSTGTAWNNFDINRETSSGKDTIHHTYGICYQKNLVGNLDTQAVVPLEKTNRKRQFSKVSQPTEIEIEPYRKKKKLNLQFDFQVIDVHQLSSYSLAITYDTLWMISSNLLPLVPM